MYELKPCPFCGSGAEISKARCFPSRDIAVFDSEKSANEYLINYESKLTVVNSGVYQKQRFDVRRRGRYALEKWAVWAMFQGFVPRCVNTKCIARGNLMFHTEEDAVNVWNARCPDV